MAKKTAQNPKGLRSGGKRPAAATSGQKRKIMALANAKFPTKAPKAKKIAASSAESGGTSTVRRAKK